MFHDDQSHTQFCSLSTYNDKDNSRNNNFMIFQRTRLKLITNLFENRLLNYRGKPSYETTRFPES